MKAVWYEGTGAAPDVLTFGDMPTPVAGPGEVRVRLHASGVRRGEVFVTTKIWPSHFAPRELEQAARDCRSR